MKKNGTYRLCLRQNKWVLKENRNRSYLQCKASRPDIIVSYNTDKDVFKLNNKVIIKFCLTISLGNFHITGFCYQFMLGHIGIIFNPTHGTVS